MNFEIWLKFILVFMGLNYHQNVSYSVFIWQQLSDTQYILSVFQHQFGHLQDETLY